MFRLRPSRRVPIKQGLHIDSCGQADYPAATTVVVRDWAQLCGLFERANRMKQTAATQWSPSSTQGHTICVFQVETPLAGGTTRQVSQLYVCDMAGSDPASQVRACSWARHGEDALLRGPCSDLRATQKLQAEAHKTNLELQQLLSAMMKPRVDPLAFLASHELFAGRYLARLIRNCRSYVIGTIHPELQLVGPHTCGVMFFIETAGCVTIEVSQCPTYPMCPQECQLVKEIDEMHFLLSQAAELGGASKLKQMESLYHR